MCPFTFVIKGLEGFIVGKIAENKEKTAIRITAIIAGGIIMIVGYYLVEVSIFMIPPAVALIEVPFNIIRMSVGGFVAILLAKKVKNLKY
ncbi:MAG: ECF transporter S component [Candidatus Methanofastidiosum sp.]|nr:ECF transporter S component [Methanofastidiosum sp.]